MTVDEFAVLLGARRTGTNKWQALCPAHHDRSPSLSFGEGADGRVLLHCFAGCSTANVLEAIGLKMKDLFPGGPFLPENARLAALVRMRRSAEKQAQRQRRGKVADDYRRLSRVVDALGAKLARARDDAPGADALTKLFHESLELFQQVEEQITEV